MSDEIKIRPTLGWAEANEILSGLEAMHFEDAPPDDEHNAVTVYLHDKIMTLFERRGVGWTYRRRLCDKSELPAVRRVAREKMAEIDTQN